MDSTGKNPKENGDNDEEEDDLTQEFECQEERGHLIHKKLEKSL